MTSTGDSTFCGACGGPIGEPATTLPAEKKPCPLCGSLTRNFHAHVTESLTVREKFGMKLKRPGIKKPVYESVAGDDLHRATGQWNKLTREIDRENNRYNEVIADSQSGEVFRQCDEPLTKHTGRGSAKPKLSEGEQNT